MNDFSEIEAELKQLRPVTPSPELLTRVEQALRNSRPTATAGVLPRRPKSRVNWFALGFGLAAAAALLLLARAKVDRPTGAMEKTIATAQPLTEAARTLQPDGVTRVVYDTSDEGLVYPRDSVEPVRRVRSRSRETLHWKDPGSGASLRVSYPTEDVELIPVSFSSQ